MGTSEKIGNLTELRRIKLNNNCLTKLPKSIGNLINLEKSYDELKKNEKTPEKLNKI